MTIKIKNTSWKSVDSFKLKVSGAWKNITQGYIKVAGAWKQFFTSTVSPSIESQVSISQSTSGTTGLVTLTGQNNYWINSTSLNYDFNHSTGGSYSSIKSSGATNPSGSGGSTTNTYILGTLSASDVTANTSNYYTYSVTAYNSTYSTTTVSTSSSTTVEGARNISNLATSNPGYYSVDLSWTAGAYNNSYRVRYGTVSGSLSSYVDVSGTSTTISGLSSSTTYYFTVTPYTGSIVSSAVTGYAGNTSSEVSRLTNTLPPPSPPADPTGITVYKYDPTTTTNNLVISWNASSGATYYSYQVYDYVTATYLYDGATTTNTYTPSLNVGNSRTIWVAVRAYNSGGSSPGANYIYYNCGPAPSSPTSAYIYGYYLDGTGHQYAVSGGAGHGWMIQSNQYSSLFSSSSASYIIPSYTTQATGTSSFVSGTTYYPYNYGNLTVGRAYKTRIYSFTTGRSYGVDTNYTSSSPYTFYYVRALAQATPSTPTVTSSPSYTTSGSGISRTLNYNITLTHDMSNLHHFEVYVAQYDNGVYTGTQVDQLYATTGYETNSYANYSIDQLSSESYTSSLSRLNVPIPVVSGHTYTYKIYIYALGLYYSSGFSYYFNSPAIIDVV